MIRKTKQNYVDISEINHHFHEINSLNKTKDINQKFTIYYLSTLFII